MARYARIENGVVVEQLETSGNISEMFPAELIWVDITGIDGVSDGWVAIMAGGQWCITAPVPIPAPEMSVAQQIAELEVTVTSRKLREAILTGDHSFLQSVEGAITQLRSKL